MRKHTNIRALLDDGGGFLKCLHCGSNVVWLTGRFHTLKADRYDEVTEHLLPKGARVMGLVCENDHGFCCEVPQGETPEQMAERIVPFQTVQVDVVARSARDAHTYARRIANSKGKPVAVLWMSEDNEQVLAVLYGPKEATARKSWLLPLSQAEALVQQIVALGAEAVSREDVPLTLRDALRNAYDSPRDV